MATINSQEMTEEVTGDTAAREESAAMMVAMAALQLLEALAETVGMATTTSEEVEVAAAAAERHSVRQVTED